MLSGLSISLLEFLSSLFSILKFLLRTAFASMRDDTNTDDLRVFCFKYFFSRICLRIAFLFQS